MRTFNNLVNSLTVTLLILLSSNNIQAQFNPFPGATGLSTIAANQKVGIGAFPTIASVQAKLHVNYFLLGFNPATDNFMFRTDGLDNVMQRWQMFTGPNLANTTEKFAIFTTNTLPIANFTTVNNQHVTIQATQRDMIFNAGGNFERMRILGQNHNLGGTTPWFAVALAGNIGMGTAHPMSRLHIGGEGAAGGGWRPWMDVGTFYASVGGFDNMYVGLRQVGFDANQAIINWGNNPAGGTFDRMLFVFTAAAPAGVQASGINGLEIVRIASGGNANNSFMGIGGDGVLATNPYSGGVDPANTLEVNSTGLTAVPGGSSGLRLTNLTTASPTIANPGLGVLAVNAFGDVIYVPAIAGTAFGALCVDPPGAGNLLGDTKVGLNDFSIYYEDGASSTVPGMNRLSVGYLCTDPLPAKVSVDNISEDIGTYSITRNVTPTGFEAIGIKGESIDNGGFNSIGVSAHAAGSAFANTGVASVADNVAPSATVASSNTGGRFTGQDATIQNIGIGGFATGAGVTNIGVLGLATGGATNFAGYFSGDVFTTGAYLPSDENIKEGITELSPDSASYYINSMSPKTFQFQTVSYPHLNLPDGHQYGMIAQDVEAYMPSLIIEVTHPAVYAEDGTIITPSVTFKGLDYNMVIPILVADAKGKNGLIDSLSEMIEGQNELIGDLQAQMSEINECLADLCSPGSSAMETEGGSTLPNKNSQNVELKDAQSIVLDQNVPNPFAERTVISFQIPAEVKQAQILFHNEQGKLINTVDLSSRGAGQLNVYGADLSSGIYTYTLIADGNIIDTKRMVKLDLIEGR